MCGLRTRPRTDVNPPRVELHRQGGISSRSDNLLLLLSVCFSEYAGLHDTSAVCQFTNSSQFLRSSAAVGFNDSVSGMLNVVCEVEGSVFQRGQSVIVQLSHVVSLRRKV